MQQHRLFHNIIYVSTVFLAIIFNTASASETTSTTVYKYVDAQGVLHLTNKPTKAKKIDYARSYLIQPAEKKVKPVILLQDDDYELLLAALQIGLPVSLPHLPTSKKIKKSVTKLSKLSNKNTRTVDYLSVINKVAVKTDVPAALLQAVINVESNYNPEAISPKGAVGLMQLMPATAKRYGVNDRTDPQKNISGGAHYLRDLLKKFEGDLSLVLAAYNAGENAVVRYGHKIPPYKETQNYVKKVLKIYNQLK